jgi:type I restriction enzyme S subunit
VAPLPEQHRIVEKIESLFSELDNSIATLQAAQQQLQTYRQSVLKHAFEGYYTGGMEGWENVKLNNIGKWQGGGTPSKSNQNFWTNGSLLWVSPKDMKSKYITNTIDKITEEALTKSTAKLIDTNSLLFVVRSGILRNTLPVAISKYPLTVNQDLQAFTPTKDVNIEFLYWFFIANNEQIRNTCSKNGTTVESIETKMLKTYHVQIPIKRIQNQIVKKIESLLYVSDGLVKAVVDQLAYVETLKQSILLKAFSGELLNGKVKSKKILREQPNKFEQIQIVGYAVEKLKRQKEPIIQGEMGTCKYLYLMDRLHNVNTGLNFQNWHLGPFAPEVKQIFNNRQYFTKKGKDGSQIVETLNTDKLFKYNNVAFSKIDAAAEELAQIFGQYPANLRSEKVELMATVCKCIEDTRSTGLEIIRKAMKDWPIKLKNSPFKNKAEKFSEEDTNKCIGFIVNKNWNKKLIKNSNEQH